MIYFGPSISFCPHLALPSLPSVCGHPYQRMPGYQTLAVWQHGLKYHQPTSFLLLCMPNSNQLFNSITILFYITPVSMHADEMVIEQWSTTNDEPI